MWLSSAVKHSCPRFTQLTRLKQVAADPGPEIMFINFFAALPPNFTGLMNPGTFERMIVDLRPEPVDAYLTKALDMK